MYFKLNRSHHRFSGPPIMLLGYFLFGFVPIGVRVAQKASWDAVSTTFARFVIACLCILFAVLVAGKRIATANAKLLVLRGLFGGAAVICYFVAVVETGAATGTLLTFTHSIWANVLSVVILRQQPSKGFWILLLLAVAGLWLVIDPSFNTFRWGEIIGLLSGLFGGSAILCVKRLRKTDSAITVLASFSFFGLICALPFVVFNRLEKPTTLCNDWAAELNVIKEFGNSDISSITINGWIAVICVGLFSFVAQFFFTQGYKHTSVQLGTIMSLTVPVIAALAGWIFLNETITLRFLTGAMLILSACTAAGFLEKESHQPGS